ncbi:MAG: beta-1,6-N-acetylglucosaminyltransferase [Luteolibacter sp.]
MPPIGFILLVNPRSPIEQSERLIRTLNRMFDHPPIACHHDFGQNPRFIENCPANVKLVSPHVATRWGDFSCVEATIKAMRLLYAGGDGPEWFVYLSGADYPIKPAHQILAELQASAFDGHIEHKLVSEGDLHYPPDPDYPRGWKWESWLKQCHRRYCSLRLDVRGINRYLRPSTRTFWLEHPIFTRGRLPFTPEFKCYAGEVWFTGNHRCARRILDFDDNDERLAAHYRRTLVPEESYLQTVLGNAPDLKLSQNYLRYVDWTGGGSNPKVLTKEDLPFLIRSKAHFARKFDEAVNSSVLDELDQLIL